MPSDAKVGNPRAGKPNGTPVKKGQPFGIPKWGWIVGIALGLIVGYLVLRNSKANSSQTSSSGSGSSPLGNTDSGGGGGAVAGSPSPNNPVFVAAGISNNGSSDPSAVEPSGDSSTSTNLAFTSTATQTTPSLQYGEIGQQYVQQQYPGADTFVPLPPSHPSNPTGPSQLPDALASGNVRRPGFQPDA